MYLTAYTHTDTYTLVCVCVCVCACTHTKSLQSSPTLCDPKDYNSPGYSVHGILQARILKWVAMLSCRRSSQPRGLNLEDLVPPALAGGFFTTSAIIYIYYFPYSFPLWFITGY